MTELTLYKCNICGKTFEDEAECREHEIEEKYGNSILAWAWSCNVNTPMQFPWPEEKWCEINILRFDTWEAYQFAYQLIETWGYCPPEVKKEDFKSGKPVILWCPDYDDSWINVRKEITAYQQVMNIAMRG